MRTPRPFVEALCEMAYTVHVELELEPHSQPIAGVLATQSLPNRPFDGWMELASQTRARSIGQAYLIAANWMRP